MAILEEVPMWNNVISKLKPTTDNCLLCNSRKGVAIFQDNNFGGEWVYCPTCKFAGTPIEWHAEVLKSDYRTVLVKHYNFRLETLRMQKMEVSSLLSQIDRYRHYKYVWERSTTFLDQNPFAMQTLRKNLGEPALGLEEWKQRGGRIIGVASDSIIWHRGKHSSVQRVKDKSYVICPVYDLPGRVLGLLAFSDDKAGSSYSLLSGKPLNGYAPFYELESSKTFENTVFITDELRFGLKMHLYHLGKRYDRLPLLVCPGKLHAEPSIIGGKDVVIMTSVISASVINLAKKVNASIHVFSLNNREFRKDNDLMTDAPVDILKTARRRALSWKTLFEKEIIKSSIPETNILVSGLENPDDTLAELRDVTTPEVMQKVGAIQSNRKIKTSRSTIGEENDQIICLKTSGLIANFLPIIDEVVLLPNGRTVYRGKIRYQGQCFPFVEDKRVIDKNFFKFADALLLENRLTAIYDKAYGPGSVTISKQLYPPASVKSSAAEYGLDTFAMRLSFSDKVYDLTTGKCFDEKTFISRDAACLWTGPKTSSIDSISEKLLRKLHQHGSTQDVFWSTLIWVYGSLLSPLLVDKTPRALVASDVPWWETWLQAIGFIPRWESRQVLSSFEIEDVTADYHVPLLLTKCAGKNSARALSKNNGNVMFVVDGDTIRPLLLTDYRVFPIVGIKGRKNISGRTLLRLVDAFHAILHDVICHYHGYRLQKLVDKLNEDSENREQILRIAIRRFLGRTEKNNCKKKIWSGFLMRKTSDYIGEIIREGLTDGNISIAPEQYKKPKDGYMLTSQSSVWICSGTFDRINAFYDKKIPLSLKKIQTILSRDGLLKGIRNIHTSRGLDVDYDWLTQKRFRLVAE